MDISNSIHKTLGTSFVIREFFNRLISQLVVCFNEQGSCYAAIGKKLISILKEGNTVAHRASNLFGLIAFYNKALRIKSISYSIHDFSFLSNHKIILSFLHRDVNTFDSFKNNGLQIRWKNISSLSAVQDTNSPLLWSMQRTILCSPHRFLGCPNLTFPCR